MKIFYTKKFLKDLAKIPAKQRKQIEEFAFDFLPEIDTFEKISNLKKLTGYDNYFRVRFNNYRVGLEFIEGELTLNPDYAIGFVMRL